ncbi:hypothetical protein AQUCO_00900161v1 [Aquilegia coerulea]|uniref:SBP-type domain-containing protein n=1 Tax=Aquilegia coerulea TaxID=218851 RepID=A0A2G5ECB1_AQUCA|nr:hypothetical protein AQUCO_00900161v1 [Aquilegia coerulea]
MEMGSSSFAGGGGKGASGSSDSSLNGLKFGKKIYFEDVGIGVLGKSSVGSPSILVSEARLPPASSVKKGRGVLQGQPPRCSVEGCKLDLTDAKPYYSRHKVCGMHSKTPKVIVGGLEQRFCQQCSRFHLLCEFDQGKRSCRRRLAGHNERRRKPQPGSIFSPRYGRVSPSFQENSTRGGGFLMDFTAYPRLAGRDAWQTVKAGNWADGNQTSPIKKLLPHQWQGNSENPPPIVYSQAPHPYLQGVASGSIFSSTRIPSAECFAGVSDSSCALSLLSNQPWDPRNQTSDLEVNNIVNGEGVSMARSIAPHSAVVTNFTNNTWNFKGNSEVSGSSHEIPRQVSQPVTNHFSSELDLAQQGNRQYMEIRHSRDFGSSTHQMHWSL